MATTDSNGVLIYQDTDNYTPIQTALNLAQSNLSALLGASTQIVKASSVSDRNAKASARGSISKANPFVVWRADAPDGLQLEYTTNGTTWRTIADKDYYDAQAAANDTGWQPITLNAGFTGTENLGVRRIGKQVFIRGAIQRTAGAFPTAWTDVGVVPAGFRPGNYFRVPGTTFAAAAARGTEWAVNTGGSIVIGSIGPGADICRVNASWLID